MCRAACAVQLAERRRGDRGARMRLLGDGKRHAVGERGTSNAPAARRNAGPRTVETTPLAIGATAAPRSRAGRTRLRRAGDAKARSMCRDGVHDQHAGESTDVDVGLRATGYVRSARRTQQRGECFVDEVHTRRSPPGWSMIVRAHSDCAPMPVWAAIYFQLTMLAYNLNCWLMLFNREEQAKVETLGHTTLATARLKFLFVAARILSHAGRVGISYSSHYAEATFRPADEANSVQWRPVKVGLPL